MTNVDFIYDEIVSIEEIDEKETIDISVSGDNLFYANDILTHNSGYDNLEACRANISGGISKIFACDLLVNISNTPASRERGEIGFHFIKTRNSGGVGKHIALKFDTNTLRITDPDDFSSASIKGEAVNLIENSNNAVFDNTSYGSNSAFDAPSIKDSGGTKDMTSALERLMSKKHT